jgi:hypothetical protein
VFKVKDKLNECQFDLWFIPAYTTSFLQPLDISVNKSFKTYYRHLWDEWMDKQTPDSNIKPSKDRVIEWTSKAWDAVTQDVCLNGWKPYHDLQAELHQLRECMAIYAKYLKSFA